MLCCTLNFALFSQKYQHHGSSFSSSACFHDNLDVVPGMKCLSADVSEKVVVVFFVFNNPRISFLPPQKKYRLHLAKIQCTGLTLGIKVVFVGWPIKSMSPNILHKTLAPNFSARILYPDFLPSSIVLFRRFLGCIDLFCIFSYSNTFSMKLSSPSLSPWQSHLNPAATVSWTRVFISLESNMQCTASSCLKWFPLFPFNTPTS